MAQKKKATKKACYNLTPGSGENNIPTSHQGEDNVASTTETRLEAAATHESDRGVNIAAQDHIYTAPGCYTSLETGLAQIETHDREFQTMRTYLSTSTTPKNANNGNEKEEEVDDDDSSIHSENGMDEILRDLIEVQERLHERDQELKMKDNDLKELQKLVHTLTSGLSTDELTEEDEVSAAVLQRTVNKLRAELEEKDRQLRAKIWDLDTLSKEKCKLEATVQDLKLEQKGQGCQSNEPSSTTSMQQHARKENVIDVRNELERVATAATASDYKEVAELRHLVEFFKSNSEKMAITNRELLKENRRLNKERM
jgi:DNA-binding winged helix-turn-helix (wHTH) protein